MAAKRNAIPADPEILAISVVYGALKDLSQDSQGRVLAYVAGKLGIRSESSDFDRSDQTSNHDGRSPAANDAIPTELNQSAASDGINALAQKWMKRNDLTVSQLSTLYSIGSEEIDLVAKTISAKSTRARMRSVLLLKCIAAYLSGGAARVSHEQLKETCLHYDAFDGPNFAAHIKSFATEISGSKQSGYTLTQRGLAAATELIKQLTVPKP